MKLPQPEKKPIKTISYNEWKDTIENGLPELVYSAEACASALLHLKIPSIVNPIALVLKDAPSSGKTVCLNLFRQLPMCKVNDEFTENAFMSGVEGQADFIKMMKDSCTIIPDLATLLHKNEDSVRVILGKLTRLLDGQGYSKASPNAKGGQKTAGEDNKLMFTMLMATTELSSRVHECMAGLGPRMMFMDVGTKEPTVDEMVSARFNRSLFTLRQQECTEATTAFIQGKFAEEFVEPELTQGIYTTIVNLAVAMSYMRSELTVTQDRFDRNEMTYDLPQKEYPWRLVTCMENMAKAHCFMRGGTKIDLEDLAPLFRFLFSSGPPARTRIFQEVIKNGGSVDDTLIAETLELTRSRSKQEIDIMSLLKFGERSKSESLSGSKDKTVYWDPEEVFTFTMSEQMQWLHSPQWMEYYQEYNIL